MSKIDEIMAQADFYAKTALENNDGCYVLGYKDKEKQKLRKMIERALESTPSSKWAEKGEPDPHGDQYDCARSDLKMGDFTDDEMANAVYMHGNEHPSVESIMGGSALPAIAYLTAAKDRIRWLSRKLTAAEKALNEKETMNIENLQLQETPGASPDVHLSSRVKVPEGWALVPISPDPCMLAAGFAAFVCNDSSQTEAKIWSAMLSAAPKFTGEA